MNDPKKVMGIKSLENVYIGVEIIYMYRMHYEGMNADAHHKQGGSINEKRTNYVKKGH